ncbi:siderophore-iron reductase FhuF [Methylopila sp. 73B]|uniref:siderophore-iron reductase FhuF n=1 Tax=Methylopila sp. 73B TaxID=1120792 RepID=UPI0018CC248B|nr:siderophore-iron reductase FhuF [Methylopila sp. 73B]
MTEDPLASLLVGPLVDYAGRVSTTQEPGLVAGVDLRDRTVLSELIDRAVAARNGADRRAVSSLWSKAHFATVIPPTLGVAFVHGQALPVALDDILIAVGAVSGATTLLVLRDAGEAFASDAEGHFDALVYGHLEPLVDGLSAATGLSRRVLWSNAGNIFDYVTTLARGALGNTPALMEAEALLSERTRRGVPNPLFRPVDHLPDGGRRRRVCCVRDRIASLSLCSTCPKASAAVTSADMIGDG